MQIEITIPDKPEVTRTYPYFATLNSDPQSLFLFRRELEGICIRGGDDEKWTAGDKGERLSEFTHWTPLPKGTEIKFIVL